MLWVLTLVPLALLVLGFPIFIILLAASAVALIWFLGIPLTVMHQVMIGGVDKFALMAIPFFVFAGVLMGRGGMSRRIVDWVMSVVGGVRGSLGITAVGTCTVFGAISGSSGATVAAVGRLLYPALREKGYDASFSSGVLTSSGAIAIVIPPSITMILYGVSSEQSVSLLFAAGIVPGLIMAFLMATYIYIFAIRKRIPQYGRFNIHVFVRATREGIWALGMPVIILGGIYAGFFSPTEAGGVACVYAILVTRLIHREISWRGIWDVSVESMYLTSQVLIIVAAAGVFSYLLTISGIPQSLVGLIQALEVEVWLSLLVINLFLLIVGCVLETASAVILLTPLLVPVATVLGVDLIHFGIIMTVNLAIGMFTPPFGINIFVAQALFDVPLAKLYRGLVPFIAINIVTLGLVTYFPELSLFLTRYLS